MPPKKSLDPAVSSAKSKTGATGNDDSSATQQKPSASKNNAKSASKKRKAQDNIATSSVKTARRSARGQPSAPVDQVKLVKYLLSPESLNLCRPEDEIKDVKSRGSDIRTYSTGSFTPFEELVCALILSRPIGHMLGLRSIRTIFNDPHNLNTPTAIKAAGYDGCRAALDQARTQHRQKTAEELVLLAEAVEEHLGKDGDDVMLQKLQDECHRDSKHIRAEIQKHVKGLAKTGLDIFARRIQGAWDGFFPFTDDKTLQALEHLGFERPQDGPVDLLGQNWGQIEKASFRGDDAQKRREAFVKVLERAVGAELEGNVDQIRQAIR